MPVPARSALLRLCCFFLQVPVDKVVYKDVPVEVERVIVKEVQVPVEVRG